MIHIFHYVFWICLAIIFYNYIGYGVLLGIISSVRRMFSHTHTFRYTLAHLPEVTLVVAAYNEEAVIEEKITNCFELDYPKDKITILFITDGSTDRTVDIIGRYPQIKLLNSPERKGKTAALNRAMNHVHTPVTVFCDANAMLNRSAIKKIVSHYASSRTGGVAGEKRVITTGNLSTVASEGLYWKYESLLKKLDAELYTVTGAAGELFSIRTALWTPVPDNVLLDDFIISARINLKGYRIAYEPRAYASELPSTDLKEERKRKIRISEGAFQSMGMLKGLFNVFKHPVLFFQFFSHRFLRWTLTPLSLPLLLLANILLVAYSAGVFYNGMLIAQVAFYLLAGTGRLFGGSHSWLKILKIFHYLLFMNYSVYIGFFRFMKGKQSGVWEKAERRMMLQV